MSHLSSTWLGDEPRGPCEFIARRYRRTPFLLLAVHAFLTLGLYGLPFDPLSIPSPLGGAWKESSSLADRLGDWIQYLGLDSGPLPSERRYDLLVFWFTALSLLLLYPRHFEGLRRVMRALGDDLDLALLNQEERASLFLPRSRARFFLLFYPALTALAMIASPWTADVAARRVVYLLVCVHILILTGGPLQRELTNRASKPSPRHVEFGLVVFFLLAPVAAWGGWLLLIFLGLLLQIVRTFMPGWLKFTMKQPMV